MSGPIVSVSTATMSALRRVENIELAIDGRNNRWSGIREMKPLIRELIEALGDYVQISDWDFELDMLVVKAKAEVEALENA